MRQSIPGVGSGGLTEAGLGRTLHNQPVTVTLPGLQHPIVRQFEYVAVAFDGLPALGFWAMIVFLGVLTVGFVYEWRKGALEWN